MLVCIWIASISPLGHHLFHELQTENKKPHNLYIFGEFDVLNDLVNDGAKRLSKSKHLSDLELLLQNDPCPPPDRWVRPTGWSRCNPSSCYAANPPEGYDLNSYGKNLVQLPKEKDVKSGTAAKSSSSPQSNDERLNPKDSNATQSTAAVSGSTSEDLFDAISHPKRKSIGNSRGGGAQSSPVPQVKTLPTESCGTPQGGNIVGNTTATYSSGKSSSSASKVKSSGSSKKKSIGRRISGIFRT